MLVSMSEAPGSRRPGAVGVRLLHVEQIKVYNASMPP